MQLWLHILIMVFLFREVQLTPTQGDILNYKSVNSNYFSCNIFSSHYTHLLLSKFLNIYDIYRYQLGIFMFLCHRNLLPTSLLKCFSLNCNIHSYATRNAANFHMPKVRTSLLHKSIIYQGPVVWNSIPDEIRNSKSLNLFKIK